MRTVEMRLQSTELCAAMAEMRMWLDEHRFEPAGFSCREDGAGVLIRVDFTIATEATAFAGRFHSHIDAPADGSEQPHRGRGVSPLLPPRGMVGEIC